MKIKCMVGLMAVALALSCAIPSLQEVPASSPAASASSRALPAGPDVSRLADGLWMDKYGYYYRGANYNFWVDIKVKNINYVKTIGIRWTTDNWATWTDTPAQFEADLGGGFERWGVDATTAYGAGNDIQYAIYGTQNGVTSWDPGNNYLLGAMGNLNVRLVGTKAANRNGKGWLDGTARVRNLAYDKKVTVVWTKDNWAHTLTTPAAYASGNDWNFSLPLDLSAPCDIQLCLAYDVLGKTYWDNNNGLNYTFKMGPRPELANGTSDYLSGFERLTLNDSGYNPLKTATATINGQPVTTQLWTNALNLAFDTRTFGSVSQLVLAVQLTDAAGYVWNKTYTFRTNHLLEPVGQIGQGTSLVWPYKQKLAAGKLLIADMDYEAQAYHVYDFASQTLTTIKTGNKVQGIGSLSDGSIVILVNYSEIQWWLNGLLVKSVQVTPTQLGNISQLEVDQDVIYVGSQSDNGILKFDAQGNLLAKLPISGYQRFHIKEGKLWSFVNWPTVHLDAYSLDGSLLSSLDLNKNTRPGYTEFGYLDDAIVGDNHIVLLGQDRIHVLDRDGNYLAKWAGTPLNYGEGSTVNGMFGSVISSLEIEGNTIYVGDFGNRKVQVFNILE